ncbi:MAG TPA: acyl-CoA thioesterase II [Alphaproteobacteria bacterium]|nr:acyl-CoA thioesterase II [Alphaproteobacteria bacterium]HAJ47002.1 acyl-CoA thioesterase II [Alphaproteobacteria bacterium]
MTAGTPFAPTEASRDAFHEVIALLDLEPIEVNVFRGVSPKDRHQRVFGGQVLGQALVAACRTVEGRVAHSLHAYFIRPGDPRVPILYEVDRSRDGRSFTTRRVVAVQHGEQIFHMSVSFQVPEDGLEHQFPMPDVPAPEDLPSEQERRAAIAHKLPQKAQEWIHKPRPIEVRPVEDQDPLNPEKMPPVQHVWFRANAPVPNKIEWQQCVLAYASDMTLLDTCLLPHGINWYSGRLQSASLDHAMWFHHPFKADEWLLYVQDSPASSGARGLNRGMIFTREGKLVASVMQEGLIRLRTDDAPG